MSKFRKTIRKVLRHTLNRPVFGLLRHFYTPSDPRKQKWRFFGFFTVRPAQGSPFRLYNNAFRIETDIFWRGIDHVGWEPETRRLWEHLCAVSSVILDIGANTGIFSMVALSRNPHAAVYSFEPQPNVYRVLEKNNAANGSRCTCEQLALADRVGTVPFYNTGSEAFASRNTTHGSLNPEWRPDDQVSIDVNVDRLENYLRAKNVPNVDLMKIDVETFEPEVLRGYGALLEQHRPIIVLEIQTKDIGRRIADIVDGMGYQFFSITEDGGITPVLELGTDNSASNYVLCHTDHMDALQPFLPASTGGVS